MVVYRNILVYSLVNLGDVVLTTSAVALLRKAYPNARITMMVRPAAADVIVNNPLIDEAIVFDYKKKYRGISGMWRMAKELRQREFDLAISFDRKLRPAVLAWLAGIPERIGPERIFTREGSRVTWLYTKTIPMPHELAITLQAENYQRIVRSFTGQTEWAEPVIARLKPEQCGNVQSLLAELPSKGMRIALCVKGRLP